MLARVAMLARMDVSRTPYAIRERTRDDGRPLGAAPDELELAVRGCGGMKRSNALAHARSCLVPFERQLFFWQRLVNLAFTAKRQLHTTQSHKNCTY